MASEHDCGCGKTGWTPTRRELLKGAAGLGLVAASGFALADGSPAREGSRICSQLQEVCYGRCAGLTMMANWRCRRICDGEYLICLAESLADTLAAAFVAGLQWLAAHPALAVVGAILVIAGVALIVVSGGTAAPVLAFA